MCILDLQKKISELKEIEFTELNKSLIINYDLVMKNILA